MRSSTHGLFYAPYRRSHSGDDLRRHISRRPVRARRACTARNIWGTTDETGPPASQLLIPYLSIALRFRYSRRQQEKRDDVVTNLLRLRGIRGYLMLDQDFTLRDFVGEFDHGDLAAPQAELGRLRGSSVFPFLSEAVRASLLRVHAGRLGEAALHLDENGNARNSHRIEVVEHADGTRHYVLVALDRNYSGISETRAQELLLTSRQVQLVKLVALGMTNAQISESLGLKVKTVENYLSAFIEDGTSHRTHGGRRSFRLAMIRHDQIGGFPSSRNPRKNP